MFLVWNCVNSSNGIQSKKIVNNGKELERIISLVEEVYKDLPNTQVYRNYKVANNSGNDREFDVFVESSLNGYAIKVAIECKDWAVTVPVEKIEAFNSKCARVPGINKKIFVSRLGYQKDAIDAASDFGVELFTANKLNKEDILDWIPIVELKLIKYIPFKDIRLVCNLSQEGINEFGRIGSKVLLLCDDHEKRSVEQTILVALENKNAQLWHFAIYHWKKNIR